MSINKIWALNGGYSKSKTRKDQLITKSNAQLKRVTKTGQLKLHSRNSNIDGKELNWTICSDIFFLCFGYGHVFFNVNTFRTAARTSGTAPASAATAAAAVAITAKATIKAAAITVIFVC